MYPFGLLNQRKERTPMTYQPDCTLPEELLDQIADNGLEALPDAIRLADQHGHAA